MIPYGRQDISRADIEAVTNVLKSDWLTQGPLVPKFEVAMAEYCNASYSLAVNSATSGLHIACLALGVGKGDLVWTSPNTFVASANCAIYCGANIDFVDIDPETYNMSVSALEKKLQEAKNSNRLPKVVIPVHFAGQSCEMEAIFELSKRYGFRIIEDASHAVGGKYKDDKVGSCRYSDITIFSFHPVKIITTGEGGLVLTNNNELLEKMRLHRSHGITNATDQMQSRPDDEIWNYQQVVLGYNYRMTDLQAALGLSQLERLNEYVEIRHKIARKYDSELSKLPLKLPRQCRDSYSSYHLYPIRVLPRSGKTQRQVYDALKKAGIGANLHYIPVYLQPYYQNLGFQRGHCPEAESYFRETISIPMYPTLSEQNQDKVITSLREIFR